MRITLSRQVIAVLLLIIGLNRSAFAAESALSGLGEPAAPESMAHPEQIFPSSPADNSNIQTSTEPIPIKNTPLNNKSVKSVYPTAGSINLAPTDFSFLRGRV